VVWNRIDDSVRCAVHELPRLCPEPEFGTRSIARQVVRASVQISRSTVQRVLREAKPTRPNRPARPAMALPMGPQFRWQFRCAMKKTGIIAVQGRVRAPYLNGKLERAFRTFRVWWRLVLTGQTQRGIQRRLDRFGAWFNEHRAHSALHGRTPQEAWEGRVLPEPIPIRARDQLQPQIEVRRRHYRDDPRLPVLEISVRLAA
jgi:transposase InsO family protein